MADEEQDVQTSEQTEEEEGDNSQEESTPSAIEVATKLHSQIKSENDRHEQLIIRQEKLAAQNMLGGKSNAGQKPEPKKEETPEEYAKRAIAGDLKE